MDTKSMDKFKAFCLKEHAADEYTRFDGADNQDWYSLSLGFFAALGHNASDSHEMARLATYQYEHWTENQ